MKAGMFFLVTAYVLSQFYRAFLAVLSPVLEAEIGAGPEDLAIASGLWFVSFAAMQIPIGWALDSIGPRRTACGLLALGGGGGAVVMALAQGPAAIWVAMVLIGIGCAPVLMASYYILARNYPPVVFATLAGVIVGVGSLGNIAAALPTAWAVEAFGWRQTLWGLAAITLVTAAAIALTVQDPDMPDGGKKGRLIDILRIRGLWPVLAMMLVCYAPAAGIRGLWSGPYLADVFAADVTRIGTATLIMGLAMVLATFIYGPLDRLLGTRKWIIFTGNLMTAIFCGALWLAPSGSEWGAIALMAAIGLFGSSYPVIMAHGRSFFPPHLVGRGVTLMNLFSIGGVGIGTVAAVTGAAHLLRRLSGRVFFERHAHQIDW